MSIINSYNLINQNQNQYYIQIPETQYYVQIQENQYAIISINIYLNHIIVGFFYWGGSSGPGSLGIFTSQ